MSEKITVALDWTPNSNHIGLYVAKATGLYKEAGLSVEMISPSVDGYKATPASRVQSGEATFAICPSETVISFNTYPASSNKPKVKAIAALLQKDDSAIVTLKSSGIDRPSKLDGKRYASYGARYEGRIVQEIIKNDGGSGDYQELALPMLGLWNTVLEGQADSTWVFMGWEGVEAANKGVELNAFHLADYKIPYGYTPVMIARPDVLADKSDTVKAFLAATAEGYKYAVHNPEEAAKLFYDLASKENPDLPTPLDLAVCESSIKAIADKLLDSQGNWGVMAEERWSRYLDWLSAVNLLTTKIQSRNPEEGVSTTLDGLRSGDVGEAIPRESVDAKDLFVNLF